MSLFIEFEGKSVEDAVETAAQKLKISKEKINYDVISYGSTGIFGLVGTKKAKIRVVKAKNRNNKSFNSKKTFKDKEITEDKETNEESHCTSNCPATPGKSKSFDKENDKIFNDKEDEISENEQEGESTAADLSQSSIETGEKILRLIIENISKEVEINSSIEPEKVVFNISGENPALMIGKKGQTLEAIQYLIEKVINKKAKKRYRIIVDVEGYLKSKKKNLHRLSTRLAEKAKRIGKPVTIGQMNSQDRKIVHMHLKGKKGIRTQSVGEGYLRKLVIFPKKNKKEGASK